MADEKVVELKEKKKKPEPKVKMLLTQYYHKYRDEVHPYTQAYVGARYGDTLKTKEEWEEELKKTI